MGGSIADIRPISPLHGFDVFTAAWMLAEHGDRFARCSGQRRGRRLHDSALTRGRDAQFNISQAASPTTDAITGASPASGVFVAR